MKRVVPFAWSRHRTREGGVGDVHSPSGFQDYDFVLCSLFYIYKTIKVRPLNVITKDGVK